MSTNALVRFEPLAPIPADSVPNARREELAGRQASSDRASQNAWSAAWLTLFCSLFAGAYWAAYILGCISGLPIVLLICAAVGATMLTGASVAVGFRCAGFARAARSVAANERLRLEAGAELALDAAADALNRQVTGWNAATEYALACPEDPRLRLELARTREQIAKRLDGFNDRLRRLR